MGWVNNELSERAKDIFCDVSSKFSAEDIMRRCVNGENSSPCELLADYIKDYHNVSLKVCDEVCEMLKRFYGKELPYFYAYEK